MYVNVANKTLSKQRAYLNFMIHNSASRESSATEPILFSRFYRFSINANASKNKMFLISSLTMLFTKLVSISFDKFNVAVFTKSFIRYIRQDVFHRLDCAER